MTSANVIRATLLAASMFLACAGADAKTLRFSSQGDIVTIDPHAQNEGFTNAFLDNIYEPLVTRGKDLKVEPCLALSWQVVNPTTTRFKLRPNVRFHDGSPFTADDVVFTIERALSDTSNFKPYLAGDAERRTRALRAELAEDLDGGEADRGAVTHRGAVELDHRLAVE